jgi:hypothetical protein
MAAPGSDADLARVIADAAARYTHTRPPEVTAPAVAATDGPGEDSERPGDNVAISTEKLSAEIEYLKNQLEEHERAAREAQTAAARLNEQLSSTKAQAETARNQVHGGLKIRIDKAESTVAQLKTQLHLAQSDAERERRAHLTDKISATARVAEMEKELASVAGPEAPPGTRRAKGSFRTQWIAIAAALLITAAGAGFYLALTHGSGSQSAQAAGRSSISSAQQSAGSFAQTRQAPRLIATGQSQATESGGKTDFTQSLDRLNSALNSFPGLTPAEVLRQASALSGDKSVCAFEWNNGNPALQFGGRGKGSLAQSLQSCAQAVEKFR